MHVTVDQGFNGRHTSIVSLSLRFTSNVSRFTSPESLYRNPFETAQVHLASSQHWQSLDFDEVGTGRNEEVGESIGGELAKYLGDAGIVEGVKDSQALALLFVRNAGDGEDLHVGAGGLLQRLFNVAMRDHLTTDLGEAREPVGDRQESVFIQHRDVSCNVPAIAQGVGRQVFTSQVPLHDVGTPDQQHAWSVGGQ